MTSETHKDSGADEPQQAVTPAQAAAPADTDKALRRAAWSWLALAVVGLPAAWWLTQASDRVDLQLPAMITGAIVVCASLVSLLPIIITRHADAMTREVSGRLGHITMRLLLTAGGLIFYLVSLPETQRFAVGLIALAWYALSWIIELISLAPKPAHPPRQPAR